jgi:hypothetical protein
MAVNPKNLKARYDAGKARIGAERALAEALVSEGRARDKKRLEDGVKALRDIVVPYFKEIEVEFGMDDFVLDPEAKLDPNTSYPIAVSFKVGSGFQYLIEVLDGDVTISKEHNDTGGFSNLQLFRPVILGNFTRDSRCLTRENLGILLEVAIDEATRSQ